VFLQAIYGDIMIYEKTSQLLKDRFPRMKQTLKELTINNNIDIFFKPEFHFFIIFNENDSIVSSFNYLDKDICEINAVECEFNYESDPIYRVSIKPKIPMNIIT